EGIDALGEASVRVQSRAGEARKNAQHSVSTGVFHGHAADTDVIVASTKAYLAALNRLLSVQKAEATDDEQPVSDAPAARAGI
ncbi:MAG TPA: alpha-isopropylmalate synthase regulatory domain-containing protein, partial [Polyangiaceae bacterium]|nr:alpha-isopropylmalate synthase regulatory domain-containing protein [Polyangiaceae bacterium]